MRSCLVGIGGPQVPALCKEEGSTEMPGGLTRYLSKQLAPALPIIGATLGFRWWWKQ